MAKTNQPLRIVVDEELLDSPEVSELRDKGHAIVGIAFPDTDLVIGPRCWRLTPELMKYLPLALKGARAKRRTAKAAAKEAMK